jgi:N-acetylglucosaminyl-diphospho-decaprenol L-rhamnosyltransferase
MPCQQALAADNAALLAQVTVVVVTFNSAHCVASLAVSLADCPHVCVVDNGSEDDTCWQVARSLPGAHCVALPQNVGFGAANNHALALTQTPFALLLNPDCVIRTADILALLRTAQQWPKAAMVTPQITNARGAPTLNYGWPGQRHSSNGPGADALTCIGNACGAVMLLHLRVMTAQDWFDTRFFLYYEDEDLCLRLFHKRQMILLDPAVRVQHRNRSSVRGRKPWYLEYLRGWHHARSKIMFTAKHADQAQAQAQRQKALAQALLMLCLRLLAPSPRLIARAWGRICGLWNAPVRY